MIAEDFPVYLLQRGLIQQKLLETEDYFSSLSEVPDEGTCAVTSGECMESWQSFTCFGTYGRRNAVDIHNSSFVAHATAVQCPAKNAATRQKRSCQVSEQLRGS